MKSAIRYIKSNCINCTKCIRACPTEALSFIKGSLNLDHNKCINCDRCIEICEQRALKVEHVDINKLISNYEYTVVLVPSSILSDFKSHKEAKQIFNAIKALGFDEVKLYSDIEGKLYLNSLELMDKSNEFKISSFCPTINSLIKQNYPTLIDNIINIDYPVEVVAKNIRNQLINKNNIGIFSICECVSKMTLAKHPYDNDSSNVDYAISVSSIFPKINRLKNHDECDLTIYEEGIQSVVSDFYPFGQTNRSIISVEGIDNVKKILDYLEFDHIKDVGMLGLFACYKGCIGGCFLWSNPFIGRLYIDKMVPYTVKLNKDFIVSNYEKKHVLEENDNLSMKEKMERFRKISEILNSLPQYDCGACGYPNCRALAEKIIDGNETDSTCRVKKEE